MKKLLVLLLLAASAAAQTLSPAVKQYVVEERPAFAISHVRVIDGTGAPAKEDQTVLIVNGRIHRIFGPNDTVSPSKDEMPIIEKGRPWKMKFEKFIDGAGMSLLPGLVLLHEHMFYPAGGGVFHEMPYSFPRLYLAAGVTSLRTGGSIEPYTDLELKKLIDAGKVPGPKMHVTGPYLEGAGAFTPQMHAIATPEDARSTVAFWAEQGATSFKAYNVITRANLKAAIDEAHRRGIKVTGHLCSIGFREAAELGIDDLEHGLIVDTEFYTGKKPDECPSSSKAYLHLASLDVNGPEIQRTIRTLVEKKVAVTSTLPVFEMFVPGRPNPAPQRVLDAMSDQAKTMFLASRAGLDDPVRNRQRFGSPTPPWARLFQMEMEFERAFARAGGLLVAGTDPTGNGGALAGFGSQREVELLVEAGFTPLEAIQVCTQNGARYLGIEQQVGTIEAGKAADLILVKGAPDKNIADIENVQMVFKDGVGYDPQKLIDSVRGLVGIR